jgi:hypothetical protein
LDDVSVKLNEPYHFIVAMGRTYSDPTIRLNIRPKGIRLLSESAANVSAQSTPELTRSSAIEDLIMTLVTEVHKGQRKREPHLERLESRQIQLVPGSNEEKIVDQKIKQLNQAIQRSFSKAANRKSWIALSISVVSLAIAAIKLFSGAN